MTDKSIKLLALAVIYGCSLIGLAIVPAAGDARILLMFASFLVTGLWFLVYWLLVIENRPR